MRKTLSYYALTLVVLLLLFQLLAFKFYWYYTVTWSDMVMHTFGGVFLALVIGIVGARRIQAANTKHVFWKILFLVFVIGIGWEVYEYIVQFLLRPVPFANFPDSISDICCDVVGGVIGAAFVLMQKRRYNSTYESKQGA